jgi:hypothetical protein
MRTRHVGLAVGILFAGLWGTAAAQPVGTFRWQLQPFCNVVTVAITQNGAVYRLEGSDDQCGGGADAASVTGTAFPNADGTIGFGLNVVTAPGGRPVHVDAEISLGTFGGTWRDSAGASGAFVLTPGTGNGGSARPLPPPTAAALPSTLVLRQDGGFVAGGTEGTGAIPASGPGSRMMWYPGKSAFRAGVVTTSAWDDASVGQQSTAMGFDTTASGERSTSLGFRTLASGIASTAMGLNTTARGGGSTAMGNRTLASGPNSTAMGIGSAAGGEFSTAMGEATVSSGSASTAMGRFSTAAGSAAVAAGNSVTASGSGSIVLGTNATATGTADGTFLFGDKSTTTQLAVFSPNIFGVRAAGGAFFYSNAAMTLGVQLAANGTQWSSLSDVRTKHHFRTIDGNDVLTRIAAMPVTEWSYKAQDAAIRHIGPTAQDFHAAFGLGEDPLRIGTLDADGVALAGVKALEARSRQQADEVTALRQEIARLRELVATLTAAAR